MEREIRPFKAQDMLEIISGETKEYGLDLYSNEQVAEQTERDGLSVTGLVDGEIVGCGGIRKMWDGVGECWLILSPEVDKYPLSAYICIKQGIEKLIDENNFIRLQAWGRLDFPQAHTLFKHLGFKPEGTAKKYTPDGVDCILYAKVRPDGNER
jgi:RimJ/RimL family protein N-acetyltransferase